MFGVSLGSAQGLTPASVLRGSLLVGFGVPYGVLRIEAG